MACILCLNAAKKPSDNNRGRRREMWLLWVLLKNSPQPGRVFLRKGNQIWPNFPGNHPLLTPRQKLLYFFFLLYPEVLLDLGESLVIIFFHDFRDHKWRRRGLGVKGCQIYTKNWKVGTRSFFFLSFFQQTWCHPMLEFMGCLFF